MEHKGLAGGEEEPLRWARLSRETKRINTGVPPSMRGTDLNVGEFWITDGVVRESKRLVDKESAELSPLCKWLAQREDLALDEVLPQKDAQELSVQAIEDEQAYSEAMAKVLKKQGIVSGGGMTDLSAVTVACLARYPTLLWILMGEEKCCTWSGLPKGGSLQMDAELLGMLKYSETKRQFYPELSSSAKATLEDDSLVQLLLKSKAKVDSAVVQTLVCLRVLYWTLRFRNENVLRLLCGDPRNDKKPNGVFLQLLVRSRWALDRIVPDKDVEWALTLLRVPICSWILCGGNFSDSRRVISALWHTQSLATLRVFFSALLPYLKEYAPTPGELKNGRYEEKRYKNMSVAVDMYTLKLADAVNDSFSLPRATEQELKALEEEKNVISMTLISALQDRFRPNLFARMETLFKLMLVVLKSVPGSKQVFFLDFIDAFQASLPFLRIPGINNDPNGPYTNFAPSIEYINEVKARGRVLPNGVLGNVTFRGHLDTVLPLLEVLETKEDPNNVYERTAPLTQRPFSLEGANRFLNYIVSHRVGTDQKTILPGHIENPVLCCEAMHHGLWSSHTQAQVQQHLVSLALMLQKCDKPTFSTCIRRLSAQASPETLYNTTKLLVERQTEKTSEGVRHTLDIFWFEYRLRSNPLLETALRNQIEQILVDVPRMVLERTANTKTLQKVFQSRDVAREILRAAFPVPEKTSGDPARESDEEVD